MSEKRKNNFLKELRQNTEYMYFIHTSMLTSRFMILLVPLCALFSVAEYRTGGAFSGLMTGILLYLLNYLAVLFTAAPAFAMKGRILYKVVRGEYVDYTVENSRNLRRITTCRDDLDVGGEVFLFRFRPCFFLSDGRTGIISAGTNTSRDSGEHRILRLPGRMIPSA